MQEKYLTSRYVLSLIHLQDYVAGILLTYFVKIKDMHLV